MAKLNLLPSKEFEILIDGNTIQGKFCLWATKRLSDKRKWTLEDFSKKMSEELSLDIMCDVILCAVEYKVRKDKKPFLYTDVDVCDWIEALGGLASENVTALFAHAGSELEEKKTESQSDGVTCNG